MQIDTKTVRHYTLDLTESEMTQLADAIYNGGRPSPADELWRQFPEHVREAALERYADSDAALEEI